MSLFLKQLSLLTGSGLSLDRSLKIIEAQKLDKKLTRALASINNDLDRGLSVYEAFYHKQKAFSPMLLAFIKSGDESGRLDKVLDDLSAYTEEESKNRAVVNQAMAYPIILLFVTLAIVVVITRFILPTFVDVFAASGTELPLMTRVLIGISLFFRSYGLIFLIFLLILIFSMKILRKDQTFKEKTDSLAFKYLPFKKTRMLAFEYQFSSLLYILRAGDVGITTSLLIIRDSFTNDYIRMKIDGIIKDLLYGKRLSYSLEKAEIFTPLLISMVRIGEDSSQMLQALEKASDYYKNDYIYRLRRTSALIEPVMIIIMSLMVGFVVFAVAIPIFDSVNAI